MNSLRILLLAAAGVTAIGCGGKPGSPASSAPGHSPPASAPESAPPVEAPPAALITAVHTQWIISDGRPKVEIALFGENLADSARVSSSSSRAVVEQIEPDPGRTLVIVAMDASASAGMYDFQYEAPGQAPIPFSIQYAGAK